MLTCTGKWPKHSICREEGEVRIEFQLNQRDVERLRKKGSHREALENKGAA